MRAVLFPPPILAELTQKFFQNGKFSPKVVNKKLKRVEFRLIWTIFDQNWWRKLNCAHWAVLNEFQPKQNYCVANI
jgi:hypothetical protein